MRIAAQELEKGALSAERLALAVRYLRDLGLVIVEDAYDPAFIAQVRAACEARLERHIEKLGGRSALKGRTFGDNHVGFFPPLFMPIADARIAAHPIAVQILTGVLGDKLQCSFYHTNTALPGSGLQPIHRDSGSLFGTELGVPHPVTSIVLNVPLCDFTEQNGSTEVWPGTHLIVDAVPEDGKELDRRVEGMASVRLNMPVGSFALRDLRLWHRGVPNLTDRPRTMFAIVYQRGWLACDPVTIPQSTWDAWPESARHVFRRNAVVPDSAHRPLTWEEIAARR